MCASACTLASKVILINAVCDRIYSGLNTIVYRLSHYVKLYYNSIRNLVTYGLFPAIINTKIKSVRVADSIILNSDS